MKGIVQKLVYMLLKYKLSANQFVFLLMKSHQMDEFLYRYLETTMAISHEELNDLELRGYLENLNPTSKDYWADGYIVTNKFVHSIYPQLDMGGENTE